MLCRTIIKASQYRNDAYAEERALRAKGVQLTLHQEHGPEAADLLDFDQAKSGVASLFMLYHQSGLEFDLVADEIRELPQSIFNMDWGIC